MLAIPESMKKWMVFDTEVNFPQNLPGDISSLLEYYFEVLKSTMWKKADTT